MPGGGSVCSGIPEWLTGAGGNQVPHGPWRKHVHPYSCAPAHRPRHMWARAPQHARAHTHVERAHTSGRVMGPGLSWAVPCTSLRWSRHGGSGGWDPHGQREGRARPPDPLGRPLLQGLSQHDAVRCPQPSEIPCRLDNAETFIFKMQGSFSGLKE